MLEFGRSDLALAGLLMPLASILAGSLGVPLPTLAMLIYGGSLLTAQPNSLASGAFIVVAGVACALVGDLIWFTVGRTYGAKILRLMCRLSLSRDTCLRQAADVFSRHGLRLLLVSRFLPGLTMVLPPLAGASAVPIARFTSYDASGTAIWISICLAIGFVFADQVGQLLIMLRRFGLDAGEAAILLVAAFIVYKYFNRRLLIRQLRMARISVEALNGLVTAGNEPVIIDARSGRQQIDDPFLIPGAIFLEGTNLKDMLARLPKNQPTIVYCACPNEVSAAMFVRRLRKLGLSNVQPLHGGIDAWRAAGFPVQPIAVMAVETSAPTGSEARKEALLF